MGKTNPPPSLTMFIKFHPKPSLTPQLPQILTAVNLYLSQTVLAKKKPEDKSS